MPYSSSLKSSADGCGSRTGMHNFVFFPFWLSVLKQTVLLCLLETVVVLTAGNWKLITSFATQCFPQCFTAL